ncbi:MAG TPA: hypothetical protein VFW87_19760 [Pirellulales bacterium]|nr:hypothetical protein [Pirellulales bacterium]
MFQQRLFAHPKSPAFRNLPGSIVATRAQNTKDFLGGMLAGVAGAAPFGCIALADSLPLANLLGHLHGGP